MMNCQFLVVMNSMMEENNDEFTSELYPFARLEVSCLSWCFAGNDYLVSLRIKYDVTNALTSDDVNDTLNYAEVYQLVSQEMSVPSQLIERVGGRIGDRLFRRFPTIEEIHLKIIKQNPPMGADCEGAGVEFLFERSLNK